MASPTSISPDFCDLLLSTAVELYLLLRGFGKKSDVSTSTVAMSSIFQNKKGQVGATCS